MSPFFSVIIPTKSRSFLAVNAVQSVLNQTFGDLEVLIIDNDDDDTTQKAIAQFSDPRVRYIRTGGLSMADNWNRGFIESYGDYTLVIGDKHTLFKHALETLYSIVSTKSHEVVIWSIGRYNEYHGYGYLKNPPETHKLTEHATRPIIEAFTCNVKPNTLFDVAYNSATHRSIVDKMLNEGAKRVCLPVAPDYSLIFQHLAYCDVLCKVDAVLSVQGTGLVGNGFNYASKNNPVATSSFIESSGGVIAFSSHVPIKSVTLEYSFLFNDYLRLRELVGRNLGPYDVNMVNYFRSCYEELIRRRFYFGVDMTDEQDAFDTALNQQSAEIQAALANRSQLAIKTAMYWFVFKWLRRLLLPFQIAWLRRTQPKFISIMQAVDWLDTHRSGRLPT